MNCSKVIDDNFFLQGCCTIIHTDGAASIVSVFCFVHRDILRNRLIDPKKELDLFDHRLQLRNLISILNTFDYQALSWVFI